MAAFIQEIDGLTIFKKIQRNAIFEGNKNLAEKLESVIKSVNGTDFYLSELVKIHEPIRVQVNKNLVASMSDFDESLATPQLKLVMNMLRHDSIN